MDELLAQGSSSFTFKRYLEMTLRLMINEVSELEKLHTVKKILNTVIKANAVDF